MRSRSWARVLRQYQLQLLLLLSLPGFLQAAAFEGFGATTPGGNNGTVVEVTSLQDDGPGTLREALRRGSNLRIVFTVGGTIALHSRLEIREQAFITIDGSTAPPPGMTLAGHPLRIRQAHDIIVTHLRVRNSVSDGILVWDGSYNVVIDHCSVTDSGDENLNITEATSHVTVSWCLIGDTRPDSFARKTKGMLIANFSKPPVTDVSLHHNLFINEFQRSPQISTTGLFDLRNNVIRNWGAYGIRLRHGAWGNVINNVLVTHANPGEALVLEMQGRAKAGPVYIRGNQGPGRRNVNALSTAPAAFGVAPVTTDPVAEVEQKVLRGVGAWPRDAVDTLLAGPAPHN